MRRFLVSLVILGLLIAAVPVPAADVEAVRYARVATEQGTLNVRAAPKRDSDVLLRLSKGTLVCIVEDHEDWMMIQCDGKTGFVMTRFLEEFHELPYDVITKEDWGEAVLSFKRGLHKLGYIKSDDINSRFDAVLETALLKLQLRSGVPLNPGIITPELQAMMAWGMLPKGKSGFIDTATDAESGLVVSVFCWDTAGVLYEEDRSVKLEITFAAQAAGGQPPYDITVRKSNSGRGGESNGDVVSNPFSYIWKRDSAEFFVYATAVDAAGNTVTACTPFRYAMPLRYQ